MANQPNDHPLSQTFARIHQLNQYSGARFGTPAESDWLSPAELLAPHSPALAAQIEATQKRLHTKAFNTIGGALIQEYQYVADRIAGTLSWLMQAQDKQIGISRIEPEFNALLRVAGSPLVSKKVGLFELTYKEQSHVYPDRATCCYWYKTDDGDYCSTCPHRTKEDRNAQLLKYMAEEYDKVVA